MLIWHDVVFVFWIRRLILRRDVDCFVREVGWAVELFEEVGVPRGEEVYVGVGGIFGLWEGERGFSECWRWGGEGTRGTTMLMGFQGVGWMRSEVGMGGRCLLTGCRLRHVGFLDDARC